LDEAPDADLVRVVDTTSDKVIYQASKKPHPRGAFPT
jgi:predicted RNA-binding protein YlxR (DUF448 family)